MTATAAATSLSPYDQIGGRETVATIVNRFYDLMETRPDFAALRAMHAADLAPMRASLTGFLTGWLGGPRDWFTQNPGLCMMSAHARVGVTGITAAQWIAAMAEALADSAVEPDLADKIMTAFRQMAGGMARDG